MLRVRFREHHQLALGKWMWCDNDRTTFLLLLGGWMLRVKEGILRQFVLKWWGGLEATSWKILFHPIFGIFLFTSWMNLKVWMASKVMSNIWSDLTNVHTPPTTTSHISNHPKPSQNTDEAQATIYDTRQRSTSVSIWKQFCGIFEAFSWEFSGTWKIDSGRINLLFLSSQLIPDI